MPRDLFAYEVNIDPELSLYVALVTAPLENRFTVEVGWSAAKVFPLTGFGPGETPRNGGLAFRLSRLWRDRDHWWVLGSIPSTVQDVGENLEKWALPYFDRILRERNARFDLRGKV